MKKFSLSLMIPVLAVAIPDSAPAQRFEGIVVVGETKRAVQRADLTLLGRRDRPVDSARTDVFGGFTLAAEKPGKFTILVRREGFMPMTTEAFELPEGEVLTDTVFLTGTLAENSIKDVIAKHIQQVFGAGPMAAMSRYAGPDKLLPNRERYLNLSDLVRSGRVTGVSVVGIGSSQCLRFTGEYGCAEIFVDGLPVDVRSETVPVVDVEAVVPIRPTELGMGVTEARRWRNARFGVVMVYTSRFTMR